jgi:ectoine hydroxylase-related dioxygenase (phytanoyl-CoA dioxygenase family)
MKHTLTDPADQAELNRVGFFTKQLLTQRKATEFLREVQQLKPDDDFDPSKGETNFAPYHMTELDTNLAYKKKFAALAREHFEPLVDDLMKDYRISTVTLFVKPPGSGAVPLHTDWNVQEDNSWPTLYLWCPLEDVGDENGPLQVLPKSHGILDIIHGAGSLPPYAGADEALQSHLLPLTVKAGECIIFDAGMLHASYINRTDRPRFAVRIACIPKHRNGVMFNRSKDDPDIAQMFEMEGDDIMQHSGADLMQGNLKTKMLRQIHAPEGKITGEEILALINVSDEIRAGKTTMEDELAAFRNRAEHPSGKPMRLHSRTWRFFSKAVHFARQSPKMPAKTDKELS